MATGPAPRVGIDEERGGGLEPDRHRRARIEAAFVDELHIARDALHAVPVIAAEIGPDQHLGDRAGMLLAHSRRDEDRRGEPLEHPPPRRCGASAIG